MTFHDVWCVAWLVVQAMHERIAQRGRQRRRYIGGGGVDRDAAGGDAAGRRRQHVAGGNHAAMPMTATANRSLVGRAGAAVAAALVGAVGRFNHRVDHPQPAQAREMKRVSTNIAPRLPTSGERPRGPSSRCDSKHGRCRGRGWSRPLERLGARLADP